MSILVGDIFVPIMKTKENFLDTNSWKFLSKTDMIILIENKIIEERLDEVAEKTFEVIKKIRDYYFEIFKESDEDRKIELSQRCNEIMIDLNGVQKYKYNIKDYIIKATGRYPSDDWYDLEDCLLALTKDGINIVEPLEPYIVDLDIEAFRENVGNLVARKDYDGLFNNLKQYLTTGVYDIAKGYYKVKRNKEKV